MGLQDQVGRSSYELNRRRWVEGQVAEGPAPEGKPYPYPLLRPIWTLEVVGGGGTAGTYTSSLICEGVEIIAFSFTVAGNAVVDPVLVPPETGINDASSLLQASLRVAFEATPRSLEVIETVTPLSPTKVELLFRVRGRACSLSDLATDNLNYTAVVEEIQEAVGAPIPVGRFLVLDTMDGIKGVRLPEAADTGAAIAGVALRPGVALPRPRSAPLGVRTEFVSGDKITVNWEATPAMRNAGTVASTPGDPVRVTNTGEPDERGQASTDIGILPTTITATWQSITKPGELGVIHVRPK